MEDNHSVPHQFLHFEIVRRLREDTDRTVYLVKDSNSHEHLVLTHLPASDLETEGFAEQFTNHLRRVSMLTHASIVTPSSFGIEDGRPYFTRPYIPGGTLSQRLRMAGPLPLEEIVNRISQIANALDYAHSQGIIHFGLNPATVLRDGDDNLMLAEFGLSQVYYTLTRINMTQLPYSAPEVLMRIPSNPAVDIYSLGAILFEMVTGRLPFEGATRTQFLQAHLNKQLPSIHTLRQGLPKDLQDVIERSMAKLPNLRYETGQDFAIALSEAIYGKRAYRMIVETRRAESAVVANPAEIKSPDKDITSSKMQAGGFKSISRLYADALMVEHYDPNQALDLYRQLIELQPQLAKGEVIERLHRLEQIDAQKRISDMILEARVRRSEEKWGTAELIANEILSYDPENAEASEILKVARQQSSLQTHYHNARVAADLEQWNAAVLLMREITEAYPTFEDPENLLVLHTNVARYIRERHAIKAHKGQILGIAFSPDGNFLASGATDRSVSMWAMPAVKPVLTHKDHQSWVCSTLFSPDGRFLFSATWDGVINLWEMPSGTFYGVIAGLVSQVRAMAFAFHNPSLLATASGYFLTFWQIPEGKRYAAIRDADRLPITALAFSPTEPLLATGIHNGSVRLRFADQERFPVDIELRAHEGPVYAISFSPFGSHLVTGGRDGIARIVDRSTGEVQVEMHGHEGPIYNVAYSRDGTLVATAGADETIRFWRASDGEMLVSQKAHQESVQRVAFSPDGRVFASAGSDGMVKVWGL